MNQWGDAIPYSYLLGVYSTLENAISNAKDEEAYHNNKYFPVITRVNIDKDWDIKEIKTLNQGKRIY